MNRTFYIGNIPIHGRVLNAPMTGVSDLPFRRAASKCGSAYVATEMVACELLAQGRPDVVRRAAVGDGLPLMVVQLVGRDARWIAQGAAMAEKAGAQIVDLNMGCPAKEVSGRLAGAALMRDLDHAKRLIDAAVESTRVPVTLKMRLGWDEESRNAPELAKIAEQAGVQAITVHGRTRRQLYNGNADWRAVAEVRQATRLPLIVNGDIIDAASAREALARSQADAVMIGRGAYGRPWIAAAIEKALAEGGNAASLSHAERLAVALEHFRDTLRFYGDALGLKVFRKHLGWYVLDAPWPAREEARRTHKTALCRLTNPRDVEACLTALWSGAIAGRA